jgi:hypothetical protein
MFGGTVCSKWSNLIALHSSRALATNTMAVLDALTENAFFISFSCFVVKVAVTICTSTTCEMRKNADKRSNLATAK